MISIKKYLDMASPPADGVATTGMPGSRSSEPGSDPLVEAIVQSYRVTVTAIANNGARACPSVGAHLQKILARRLSEASSRDLFVELGHQVVKDLDAWGERASECLKLKAAEVKELLVAMAHSAESMGARDQRYSDQLGQFRKQLESIATLEDLGQVRASFFRKAGELKVCLSRWQKIIVTRSRS